MKLPIDLFAEEDLSFLRKKGVVIDEGFVIFSETDLGVLFEEMDKSRSLNELGNVDRSVVLKAVAIIMSLAKSVDSPEGMLSLVAAVMGVYNADVAMGRRLMSYMRPIKKKGLK